MGFYAVFPFETPEKSSVLLKVVLRSVNAGVVRVGVKFFFNHVNDSLEEYLPLNDGWLSSFASLRLVVRNHARKCSVSVRRPIFRLKIRPLQLVYVLLTGRRRGKARVWDSEFFGYREASILRKTRYHRRDSN